MASRHQHRRPRERLPKPTRVLAISGSRPDLALSPEQKMALHNEELARWEIRHVATHNPPAIWAQSASRSGALRPGCHALGLWTGQVPRYVDRRHWSIRDAVTRAQFERGVDRRLAAYLTLNSGTIRRSFRVVQWQQRLRMEAQNEGTPAARLAQMAQHPDQAVRRAVAGNPQAPPSTLAELAGGSDAAMRRAVARNPNAPLDILCMLAYDGTGAVRRAVARNRAAPDEVRRTVLLVQLWGDLKSVVKRSQALEFWEEEYLSVEAG